MSRRLSVNFGDLSEAGFGSMAGAIVGSMKNNPFFPQPWFASLEDGPDWARLDEKYRAYDKARFEAEDGDRGKIAARKSARATLTKDLTKLAKYIDLKADGDVAKLESTGYALTKERESLGSLAPDAPARLVLFHGRSQSSLVARTAAVRGARCYETHICVGNPNIEENWRQACITSGCRRIELTGLTPGTMYCVRVRAIGKNGPGKWSDLANLMAV